MDTKLPYHRAESDLNIDNNKPPPAYIEPQEPPRPPKDINPPSLTSRCLKLLYVVIITVLLNLLVIAILRCYSFSGFTPDIEKKLYSEFLYKGETGEGALRPFGKGVKFDVSLTLEDRVGDWNFAGDVVIGPSGWKSGMEVWDGCSV
ncbi:hypothetical protein HDV00_010747 [Rhizophlyctis rosea]|nr:hypothetical protein HDV00_010747 [Rhizophlyctis rosea]